MYQADERQEEKVQEQQLKQWEDQEKSLKADEGMLPPSPKPTAVAYVSAVQILVGLAYTMLGIIVFRTYSIFLLYGAGLILIGFGLLKGRQGAWRAEIAWLGLSIVLSAIELIRGKGIDVVNLGVSISLLYYFTMSEVKDAFNRPPVARAGMD